MSVSLDAASENQRVVEECVAHMTMLARAAKLLGQMSLAGDLREMALELDESAAAVSKAVMEDLHSQFLEAEQSSKNMLAASLLSCVGADSKDIKAAMERTGP
ncbi:hypothetical protein LCGC14_0354840 [marine sediment metagenome]|uniref:Uncharacterized protein n=1 Tax=marine sediment metagenome TaxID=412755 RepID=A0A0F9TF95_9ZZZZ